MASVEAVDSEPPITAQDRIRFTICNLPTLSTNDIRPDDSCPICLNSFASVLSEEEAEVNSTEGYLRETDSELGVTQLMGCGHLFCRKDLLEWIRGFHGSCPTCRHIFLDIRPPSESDGESSDGDYFPNEEEEDEEDDLIDGDADFEFEVDEMDLELDLELDMDMNDVWEDNWMDSEEVWTDDDTNFSEAEMSINGEIDALPDNANETFSDINGTSSDQK